MKAPEVLIILGSSADDTYLEKCTQQLKNMQISFTVKVASAHRSPDRVLMLLKEFSDSKVIIAFAGHAAHLAGVIAAHALCPVIAVPIPSSDLSGLDSLLSSVQMPGGVPVAVMAIGEAGSLNAACFATQILSLENSDLKNRFKTYKEELAKKVEKSSSETEKKWQ